MADIRVPKNTRRFDVLETIFGMQVPLRCQISEYGPGDDGEEIYLINVWAEVDDIFLQGILHELNHSVSVSAAFQVGATESPSLDEVKDWVSNNHQEIQDALIQDFREKNAALLPKMWANIQEFELLDHLDDDLIIALRKPKQLKAKLLKKAYEDTWSDTAQSIMDELHRMFPAHKKFEVEYDGHMGQGETEHFTYCIGKGGPWVNMKVFPGPPMTVRLIGKDRDRARGIPTDPYYLKKRELFEDIEEAFLVNKWRPEDEELASFIKRAAQGDPGAMFTNIKLSTKTTDDLWDEFPGVLGHAIQYIDVLGTKVEFGLMARIGPVSTRKGWLQMGFNAARFGVPRGEGSSNMDVYTSVNFTFDISEAGWQAIPHGANSRDILPMVNDLMADIPHKLIEDGLIQSLSVMTPSEKKMIKEYWKTFGVNWTEFDDRILLAMTPGGNYKEASVYEDSGMTRLLNMFKMITVSDWLDKRVWVTCLNNVFPGKGEVIFDLLVNSGVIISRGDSYVSTLRTGMGDDELTMPDLLLFLEEKLSEEAMDELLVLTSGKLKKASEKSGLSEFLHIIQVARIHGDSQQWYGIFESNFNGKGEDLFDVAVKTGILYPETVYRNGEVVHVFYPSSEIIKGTMNVHDFMNLLMTKYDEDEVDGFILSLRPRGKQATEDSTIDWTWWGNKMRHRGYETEEKAREEFFRYLEHLDKAPSTVLFGKWGEEKNRHAADTAPVYQNEGLFFIGVPTVDMKNVTTQANLWGRHVEFKGKVTNVGLTQPGEFVIEGIVNIKAVFRGLKVHAPRGTSWIKVRIPVNLPSPPVSLADAFNQLHFHQHPELLQDAVAASIAQWPDNVKVKLREALKSTESLSESHNVPDEVLPLLYTKRKANKLAALKMYPLTVFGKRISVSYDKDTGEGQVALNLLLGFQSHRTMIPFLAPPSGTVPQTLAGWRTNIEQQLVRAVAALSEEARAEIKEGLKVNMLDGTDSVPDELLVALSGHLPKRKIEASFDRTAVRWEDFVNGEYWLYEDGDSDYADGDIGDQGHEGIAADRIFSSHDSELQEAMEEFLRWVAAHPEEASDEGYTLDTYKECMHDLDPTTYSPPHDDWSYMFFQGPPIPEPVAVKVFGEEGWEELNRDIRAYFQKYHQACHVINNNFGVWKLTTKMIDAIQGFILEQAEDEQDIRGDINIDEVSSHRFTNLDIQSFLTMKYANQVFASPSAKYGKVADTVFTMHTDIVPEHPTRVEVRIRFGESASSGGAIRWVLIFKFNTPPEWGIEAELSHFEVMPEELGEKEVIKAARDLVVNADYRQWALAALKKMPSGYKHNIIEGYRLQNGRMSDALMNVDEDMLDALYHGYRNPDKEKP